jgi:hypothetical protein
VAAPSGAPSRGLVGLSGFEPLTSRLSAVRSSQLSYRPVVDQEALRTLDDVVTMPAAKRQRTPEGVRVALWKLGRHVRLERLSRWTP